MKKMKRILVMIMVLALLLTSLTGCDDYREQVAEVFDKMKTVFMGEQVVSGEPVVEEPVEKEPVVSEPVVSEPVPEDTDNNETEDTKVDLEYTLNEEDIAEFEAQVLLCEEMLKNGASYEEMELAADTMDEMLCDIQDQATIAQVLYYCDMENEEAVADYLFASEVSTELTSDYLVFLIALYDNGNYAPYFEELSELELQYLECYSDETTDLDIRNSEILTEFHDLSEDEVEEKLGGLYSEFVNNANQIAVANGFPNYYDYMSTFGYIRDYGKEEREQFREYVKKYIVPSQYIAYARYEEAYKALSREDRNLVDAILFNQYDRQETNYVAAYIESLPEASKNGMQRMFNDEAYIITDYKDAYQGAFTVDINVPFCYFGPGYQDSFTMIHELGHYYAFQNNDTDWISYDLCETHSQGNEMLLLSYLSTVLKPEVHKTLEAYTLFNSVDIIVMATIMDDFEERIYNQPSPVSFTTEELEELMSQVIQEYGFEEDNEYTYMYMDFVWKSVCISSPVYYLSYATSAMAALSLYSQSLEDYEVALEAYRVVQEEIDMERTFEGTLEKAGIPSVFEEDVYIKLQKILEDEEEESQEKSFAPGKVEGTVYESPFIGLGCTLEEGWFFYTDEQIRELNNFTEEVAGEEYQEMLENARLVYDMFAANADETQTVTINLEKIHNMILSSVTVEDIFRQNMPMLEELFESMGYTNMQTELITVTIDGKDYSGMSWSGEVNGMVVYQKSIGIKCNGYLATLAVTSYNEDATDEILARFYVVE